MHAPIPPHVRRRDQGGFVLPVALLVLVLLSMIGATGLYTARADYRAAAATREAAVALAAADAGVARTVALWSSVVPSLPAPGDSLVVDWQTLPDGSQYRSVVMRAPVGAADVAPGRVMVRTVGRVAPPGYARRTVVTVVEAFGSGGPFCCEGSLKISSRLRVMGPQQDDGVPDVDGTDRPPVGWPGSKCMAPPQNVPGVVTSNAADVQLQRTAEILGTPPVLENPGITPLDFDTYGGLTYAELTSLADIAFAGDQTFQDEIGPVVTGGVCETAAIANWGSPQSPMGPCGGYAPIVHVAGNLDVRGTGQGQGILLVDGDFRIRSTFNFVGIVIVRGRLRLNGPGPLVGAVMARGGPTGADRSEVTAGGRLLYSSCAAQQAQARLPASAGAGSASARQRSWFEVIG